MTPPGRAPLNARMDAQQPVTVGVGAPAIEDVVAVARHGAPVALSEDAIGEIERTRAVVDALVEDAAPALRRLDRLRRARRPPHPARRCAPSCSAA